jgi:hypothetical protein
LEFISPRLRVGLPLEFSQSVVICGYLWLKSKRAAGGAAKHALAALSVCFANSEIVTQFLRVLCASVAKHEIVSFRSQ